MDAVFVVQPNVTARNSHSNCITRKLARPLGALGRRRNHPISFTSVRAVLVIFGCPQRHHLSRLPNLARLSNLAKFGLTINVSKIFLES
jgi:hypothetical protein